MRQLKYRSLQVFFHSLQRKLHWLYINEQSTCEILTFKTVQACFQHSSYLSEIINPYKLGKSLRSSNGNFLTKPKLSSDFGKHCFFSDSPTVLKSSHQNFDSVLFFRLFEKIHTYFSTFKIDSSLTSFQMHMPHSFLQKE